MVDAISDQTVATFPLTQLGEKAVREMPHNIQAEQSFLGALLLDNELLDSLNVALRSEHFYDPLHGQIYEAAARMIGRGQLANPTTLHAFFANDPAFGQETAEEYLTDLTDGVISIAAAKDYAGIIHETFLRRALVKLSDDVSHDARNPDLDKDAQLQIEAAEQQLFNLAENDSNDQGLQSFDKVLSVAIEKAEKAVNSDGHISGVSTGLTGLNALLGGLHPSDLLILAGRPGMGKTALATNIAFHAAATTQTGEEPVPVAFFSLEMSADQLGVRILAERSNVDSEAIRRGTMDSRQFVDLVETSGLIDRTPFFIDDSPALSVSQLASRARRLKRTSGLGLVVVDYLQLLQAQLGSRPENRVQEISNISRSLKALAKELDVPVLALSQLSRAVEQREDKRPNLSDLRESGSIEQDADVVMFVYREEYYLGKGEPEIKDNETQEKFNLRYEMWQERLQKANGTAEVIIAKQRHGPTGVVNVGFEGRLTKFSDLAEADHLPDSF